jgi:hypothetical protein
MTVKKNKSSEKGRDFWEVAAQASKTVEAWPAWKRGESTLETKTPIEPQELSASRERTPPDVP